MKAKSIGNPTLEKLRRLPWFYTHHACNTIFWIGMFSTVFTLFLDALGLDKTRIGLLQALIPLAGLSALIIAPWVERVGFKRVLFTFWLLRKVVVCFLFFTPWVMNRWGSQWGFYWIAGIISLFAFFRAIGETSYFPWAKELIPDNIRGKVNATITVICSMATMMMLVTAGFVLDHLTKGLQPYFLVMGIALFFGFISAFVVIFFYGGETRKQMPQQTTAHFAAMKTALRDSTFMRYLLGVSLLNLVFASLPFLALYLKESIGLRPSVVVRLDIGMTVGGVMASLLWGWASDRFGSKPIMMTGLSLMLLLPIGWFFIPHHPDVSVLFSLGIAFLAGIAINGWAIGGGRYLYVSALPEINRTTYMSLYYAILGITGSLGPFLAGGLIDQCKNLSYQWRMIHIDKYSPYFLILFILLTISMLVMRTLRSDDSIPTRRFLGMLFQGSPFLAAHGLFRHYTAKDETQRLISAKTLGRSGNTLSSHELIEALNDPSFNVRYEAIIAIAHLQKTHAPLLAALQEVLNGQQPELSVTAAWALGQLGDRGAIDPLRQGLLQEDYPLLEARCARSLAALNDTASIDLFRQKLAEAEDTGLKLAYASALGILRDNTATKAILDLLDIVPDQAGRAELTLALARIVGDERRFIRFWRGQQEDFNTVCSKMLVHIKKHMVTMTYADKTIEPLDMAVQAFGHDDNDTALQEIIKLVENTHRRQLPAGCDDILNHGVPALQRFGLSRPEYLILLLHTLSIAVNDERYRRTHRIKKK